MLETVEEPDGIITIPTQPPEEQLETLYDSELITKEEFIYQEDDVSFADDGEYEDYMKEYMQQQAYQANNEPWNPGVENASPESISFPRFTFKMTKLSDLMRN